MTRNTAEILASLKATRATERRAHAQMLVYRRKADEAKRTAARLVAELCGDGDG